MKAAASKVAFGLRAHTGWAVLVAVAGPLRAPRVHYRARLELCDGSFPRFVYHQAQAKPITEARALIGRPERELWEVAGKALRMNDAALRRRLEAMGRAAGRPWGQDQKLAALGALVGLAGR